MIDVTLRLQALEREAAALRRDLRDARALADRAERAARVAQAGASGSPPWGAGGPVRPAKSAGSISAATSTAPGYGVVQPLKTDSGSFADDGPTLTAYNLGAAVSTGKKGFLFRGADGRNWFTPEECG